MASRPPTLKKPVKKGGLSWNLTLFLIKREVKDWT
jgi:hypothetical protein